MITLAKSKISDVTVEMIVEETIGNEYGGYPIILFGDVNIQSKMVAEVDTLILIKAINVCDTIADFEEYLEENEVWMSHSIVTLLKSFVSELDVIE